MSISLFKYFLRFFRGAWQLSFFCVFYIFLYIFTLCLSFSHLVNFGLICLMLSYGCVIPGFLFLWPTFQFSSVTQLCPTPCDPMNHSTPGLPVHHKLLESTHTHDHWVSDAIQPSHPLLSPSLPAPNPSQHQGLFQWVNSSHEVAKVLEFQLQHQSFQWTPRTDIL